MTPLDSPPPADDQAAAPDPLTAFADDVERRMPNLREPDALSDWSMGVVWMLDRMRNAATEGFARPAVAVPAETRDDYAWAEMLTEQTCPAGMHATWYVDSEHHHACPWCGRDEARAQVAAVRALAERWADAPADTHVTAAAVLAALEGTS